MRRTRALFASRFTARLSLLLSIVMVGWFGAFAPPSDENVPLGPNSDTEAFISADEAEYEGFDLLLTGRFSVDFMPRGVIGERPGPQHVTANAAVASARRHGATTIYIDSWNHQWVTGRDADPFEDQPLWPAGGIVFHRRYDYEPIAGPRPIAWWVRLSFGKHAPSLARITSILTQPGRCERIHVVDAGKKPDVDCLVPFDPHSSATTTASRISAAVPFPPLKLSWWQRLTHRHRGGWVVASDDDGVSFEVLGPVGQPRTNG